MFWLIAFLAILMSLVIVVMVLLQPSKGGGAGGAFGALGSNLGSTFGSRRTLDFLAKGTSWAAGGLGLLCIVANILLAMSGDSSVRGTTLSTEGKKAVPSQTAPAPGGGLLNGGGKAPAGGGTVPPAGGGTAPPAGGGTAPPAGGGTAPPANGGTAPPAGGGK